MQRKLGFEIHITDILIKRSAEGSAEFRRNQDLTGTHGYILGYLLRRAGQDIFQRDIERHFGIRRSTASQLVQLMERNGLVERVSVPYDARLKKIVVTDKGRQLHAETICALEAIDRRALAGIEEDRLAVFYSVLDDIKRNLGAEECAAKPQPAEE